MIDPSIKLVALVGPTASGKTALALELAEKFGAEIICADSRTIYRYMDIGTAKPNYQEQRRVPHHLIDIIDPDEVLSAAGFKAMAETAIADIASRGRVPMLVGGSGLYLDAVLFDYRFPPPAEPAKRRELETLTNEQLRARLALADPDAFTKVDLANRRRVIRAIETAGYGVGRLSEVRPNTLVLGKRLSKEVTQRRVEERVNKMLEEGFIGEVRMIGERFGWNCEGLQAIGYRAFEDVVKGTKTLEAGKADFVRGDMMLYKKQVTWFKRNLAIHWIKSDAQARHLVAQFLGSDV